MRWMMLAGTTLLATGCGDAHDPCTAGEPGVICAVAGSGSRAYNGDDLPAHETAFYLPSAIEPAPDGRLHIVDFNNQRIRILAEDGTITTVVGSGDHNFAFTGVPAQESPLENPIDLAFDAAGRLMFVSYHDPRVLYVDDSGILRSMAGLGEIGDTGDGGPAEAARFTETTGIAVGPDGTIYVADGGAHRVRAIGTDGIVRPLAGTGEEGFAGHGGPATQALLRYPTALAVDAAGRVYIADAKNHVIWRVDERGVIAVIAGTGEPGFAGDGGPATDAMLEVPEGLAVLSDGSVLVSDWNNNRIRKISIDGVIATVAGTGEAGISGNDGPAIDAMLSGPARLAVDGNVLYLADQRNDCVRAIYLP